MGKLIVTENITLDGVIQDPTGEEGFGRGAWAQMEAEDQQAWAEFFVDEALAVEAMLLGRRTYEYFAGRFPSRTGVWADRLNSMPKYVVSTTLEDAEWNNSTVLTGDVVDDVSKLKETLSGDLVVYASGRLVPTLLEHDLVDELRLMMFPCVLGAGERMFGETSEQKPQRLVDNRTIGDGLVLLTYQRAS
jgi:dihydrofolate reductase